MQIFIRSVVTSLFLAAAAGFTASAQSFDEPSTDRGRYLIRITGCNDCHSAGFAASGGQLPESEWLKGDRLGWRGDWGTTYAPNLRLTLSEMTEDQWVFFARNLQSRPPMPSFNVNVMTETDLRSMYRFVRQLQPLGEPAPAYVPPDQEPNPPYVTFPADPKAH